MEKEHQIEEFNKVINFALDETEGEGLLFLKCWREGDWSTIEKEFSGFKISECLRNP